MEGETVNTHIAENYEMEDVIERHDHSTPKDMTHIHRCNNGLFIKMQ